ncbi:hypothetical protein [Leisingera caerulea]|uniref:hypothetical protein n=1 Tax=Leisingera caerulea TaxID=506591 RepID=UPI003F4A9C2A
MIVALDNTLLTLLLNPSAKPPVDPNTGVPLDCCDARVKGLIEVIEARSGKVIIPSPSLAEALVAVPSLERALEVLNGSTAIGVVTFDQRCAIELADVTRRAKEKGTLVSKEFGPRQAIKNDRQIAITAKVNKADVFYTDDARQTHFAEEIGLPVKHTWDLPIPAKYAHGRLNLID